MVMCKPRPSYCSVEYDSEVKLLNSRLVSCLCKNPAACVFRRLCLFLENNNNTRTCSVSAAAAVQKLLAELRLKSAMAESSRGKLVYSFILNCISDTKTHTHTLPATCPESPQVCAQASAPRRFARFLSIYTYTAYIDYKRVCVCVVSGVCEDVRKSKHG